MNNPAKLLEIPETFRGGTGEGNGTAESALEELKQHLFAREEEADGAFEVEEQGGVLNVVFDEPGAKFVITPNTPVRQIWISALSTSFKLDLAAASGGFVLERTGEALIPLVDRLIGEFAAN